MSKPSYSDLLRHPSWQRKRLEILEREDFTCEQCGGEKGEALPLHVHHMYYERGLKPWEYPDESLRCLCETCHKEQGELDLQLERLRGRLTLLDTGVLLGFAAGLILCGLEDFEFKPEDHAQLSGVAQATYLGEGPLIEIIKDKGKLSTADVRAAWMEAMEKRRSRG